MERTWAILVIASILILGALGFSQDASAVTFTLSDQESCEDLGDISTTSGITWVDSTSTCTVEGVIFLGPADELVIPKGVTLNIVQFTGGGAAHHAHLSNEGSVTNNGIVMITVDTRSTIFSEIGRLTNQDTGEFVNNGKIIMLLEDFLPLFQANLDFKNHGTFLNNGEIELDTHNTAFAFAGFSSDGEFLNACTGEVRLGQDSVEEISVDISGNFANGGTYLGFPDPDIHDDTVLCISALSTIDALQAIIDELLANALSTFSTAFVQPILDAVDDLITSGDIDGSEEGSLTRTLDRSLTTAERADGIACKGAAALVDDVTNLIATTDLTQADAKDLIDRAEALLISCTP